MSRVIDCVQRRLVDKLVKYFHESNTGKVGYMVGWRFVLGSIGQYCDGCVVGRLIERLVRGLVGWRLGCVFLFSSCSSGGLAVVVPIGGNDCVVGVPVHVQEILFFHICGWKTQTNVAQGW